MRQVIRLLSLFFVILSVWPVAAQADWAKIESRSDYINRLAERSLTLADGSQTYTSHKDGRVTGLVEGADYTGSWTWQNGTACFDGAAKGQRRVTACASVQVNGRTARFSWIGWKTLDYQIGER